MYGRLAVWLMNFSINNTPSLNRLLSCWKRSRTPPWENPSRFPAQQIAGYNSLSISHSRTRKKKEHHGRSSSCQGSLLSLLIAGKSSSLTFMSWWTLQSGSVSVYMAWKTNSSTSKNCSNCSSTSWRNSKNLLLRWRSPSSSTDPNANTCSPAMGSLRRTLIAWGTSNSSWLELKKLMRTCTRTWTEKTISRKSKSNSRKKEFHVSRIWNSPWGMAGSSSRRSSTSPGRKTSGICGWRWPNGWSSRNSWCSRKNPISPKSPRQLPMLVHGSRGKFEPPAKPVSTLWYLYCFSFLTLIIRPISIWIPIWIPIWISIWISTWFIISHWSSFLILLLLIGLLQASYDWFKHHLTYYFEEYVLNCSIHSNTWFIVLTPSFISACSHFFPLLAIQGISYFSFFWEETIPFGCSLTMIIVDSLSNLITKFHSLAISRVDWENGWNTIVAECSSVCVSWR